MSRVDHLGPFPVVEFRRYVLKAGEGDAFARYFDAYFPEAFEHAGALILGQFLERGEETTFTWIRGFRSMDERATVNTAFYTGPLWKEHAATMNDRIVDIDNVLLLHPLAAERGLTVLPAVDPVLEPGGGGVLLAHVLRVEAASLDAVTAAAVDGFAAYADAGAREVGVLTTLDAENNFPALPFRTDGPYVVWFGLVLDDVTAKAVGEMARRAETSLSERGGLVGAELVVGDPTPRSRLRWPPA